MPFSIQFEVRMLANTPVLASPVCLISQTSTGKCYVKSDCRCLSFYISSQNLASHDHHALLHQIGAASDLCCIEPGSWLDMSDMSESAMCWTLMALPL